MCDMDMSQRRSRKPKNLKKLDRAWNFRRAFKKSIAFVWMRQKPPGKAI